MYRLIRPVREDKVTAAPTDIQCEDSATLCLPWSYDMQIPVLG
jgi:hypothetical protein